MEQLAPHQKVFVAAAYVRDENHGSMGCRECHGGNPEDSDFLTAHDGVVRDPSFPPGESVCADCHPDIADKSRTSLHATLGPYARMIRARATPDPGVLDAVDKARATHCNACHASCGQCHVSRPAYVGGGLLDGHAFLRTPPMRETCTACHGSRVEKEYFGKNAGTLPDVHWRKRFFTCMDCHPGQEMHGSGLSPLDRYDVANGPRCEHCHLDIFEEDAPNSGQHVTHRGRVACQVCHSMAYKNCYNCHFGLDPNGFRHFSNQAAVLNFKIGRNSRRTVARPERFVLVRHVPVAQDTFSYYAENGLSSFNALPVWKMATPHNIRRKTPQNASCNACHGSKTLFLLSGDVRPGERAADGCVIVTGDMVPAIVDNAQKHHQGQRGEGS